MTTQRLEAFSDGVFAIAITLLVLEFKQPKMGVSLWHGLVGLWPSLLAYGVSFLLIGLIWANHHEMFTHIKRADRNLLLLNTLLLADVAFLPFPTSVLAAALRHTSDLSAAAFFYGLSLTIGGVFYNALWFYVTARPAMLSKDTTSQYIMRSRRKYLFGGVGLYLVATLFALVWPWLALAGFIMLIFYHWLPPARGEAD